MRVILILFFASIILLYLIIALLFSLNNKNYNKKSEYIWTDKKRDSFGFPVSFTRYILTEKKLITRTGFLSIKEDEVELYRVVDKSLTCKLSERLCGCGTITLNVRDTDTAVKVIKNIKKPRKILKLLDEYIDTERNKYRVRGRDMIGSDIEDCDN